MKNVIELSIMGQRLQVQSGESPEYIRGVESYLAGKIEEVRQSTKAVATLDLALLVALNVTGELMRTKDKIRSIEERSDELAQAISKELP